MKRFLAEKNLEALRQAEKSEFPPDAICLAIEHDFLEALPLLIDYAALPLDGFPAGQAPCGPAYLTSLAFAAFRHSVAALAALLARGADVNAETTTRYGEGSSALLEATRVGGGGAAAAAAVAAALLSGGSARSNARLVPGDGVPWGDGGAGAAGGQRARRVGVPPPGDSSIA